MNCYLIGIFLFLIAAIQCRGQFVEVTEEHDIHSLTTGNMYGNGVSFYDFNHDGWDDLSMASGASEPQFFINNQGQFEQVNLGILNSDGKQVHAIQWIDWDNDGDSDLFITRMNAVPRLMRNDGDLTFTDITSTSGINQGIYIYLGAAWTDYDKDGNLDFYLSKYYNPNNYPGNEFISRMYKGNGDGTFVDVTQSAGIYLQPRPCFQPVWLDYNNDGWEDLYLIIDRDNWRNEMFKNNGDGSFTNVTDETATGVFIDAMTGTVGDYDNDLDHDIYVTNGYGGNKLFRNEDGVTFSEIAEELGLEVGAICWGANWIDYDNNTWQDLFVGATGSYYGPYQNQFFINDQNGGFYSGIEEVGLLGDISPTMATTMGDINNDGYYDYFNANNAPYEADLWQNLGGTNHWLGVMLEGTYSNRNAFGSILKLHCGNDTWMRCVHGGENFLGQNSGKEIFGMAEIVMADSLEIFWPLGLREVYYNIACDQYLYLKEGDSHNTPAAIAMSQTSFCAVENIPLTSDEWTVISWSDGTINDTLWINDPGTYTALIEDEFGHFFYTEPLVIEEFSPPSFEVYSQEILCHNDSNGALELVFGENSNYNYVLWNDGQYFGEQISALAAGEYVYAINYEQNCNLFGSAALNMPDSIEITATYTQVTCAGGTDGSAVLNISGGTGEYVSDWFGADPSALGAGNYVVHVIDTHSCVADLAFEITEPEPLSIGLFTHDVQCFGLNDGFVAITEIEGGNGGYSINWNEADTTALSAGNYQLVLYDQLGCSLNADFVINQPDQLSMEFITSDEYENGAEGTIYISNEGGTPPYSLYLNGQSVENYIQNLNSGEYEIAVEDAHGCVLVDTVFIDFIAHLAEKFAGQYYIFPNPGSQWIQVKNVNKTEKIDILDISGKVVMQTTISSEQDIEIAGLSEGWYFIRFENPDQSPLHFMKY